MWRRSHVSWTVPIIVLHRSSGLVLLQINAAPCPGVPRLFLPSAISVSYRTTLWHSIRCTTMEILLTLCPNCVVYAWANFIPTVWLKELKFFHTRKSAICICWDAGWLFFATIKHLLLCWSVRHFPFDVRYMWLMPFSFFFLFSYDYSGYGASTGKVSSKKSCNVVLLLLRFAVKVSFWIRLSCRVITNYFLF